MKVVLPKIDVDYHGLDIVESVIKSNKRDHENQGIRFSVANICEDRIPDCDLLMVRDCLFHLSYSDTDKFLRNLAKVDYKYLLTTTHTVRQGFLNADIKTGEFRLIDLFAHPFCFSREGMIDSVDDYPPGYSTPRKMILVAKKDVPAQLAPLEMLN